MPGIFSKASRPVRPGAYFDWSALPQTVVLPNVGSVVLIPLVHDWGPAETPVETTSLQDFQAKFGPTTTTPGYAAVLQAFEGEGVNGRGGAGGVIAYRMVSDDGAAATVAVPSTGGAAVTLTAKYPGSYGNNLGWKNTTNAGGDATKNDLSITLLGQVVETYSYAKTDITDLAAQITAESAWVTPSAVTSGTAIATAGTITALAGGDDGSVLASDDWQSMLDACGTQRFSLFAPFDLTDPAILTSIQVWAINANLNGRRFITVVGGELDEIAADAIDRSTALQGAPLGTPQATPENFVNVGFGSLVDSQLGILSTSQLAPRIAGIMAARGESMSLTFARLVNTSAGTLPTDADILSCFNGGVVVFGQDSNAAAPIRVEKGLTVYTGGDATKPYLIYRNPKFVRTMQGIELDITDWATSNAIGSLQVNDTTRAFIVGHANAVIQARADQGVIQPGFTVGVDPNPPPSDDDEFVALVYGIAFGRSVEQIFNLVYIS